MKYNELKKIIEELPHKNLSVEKIYRDIKNGRSLESCLRAIRNYE